MKRKEISAKKLARDGSTQEPDVFGCLRWAGKPKSIEEMDAFVLAEAKRRFSKFRRNRP